LAILEQIDDGGGAGFWTIGVSLYPAVIAAVCLPFIALVEYRRVGGDVPWRITGHAKEPPIY